MDQRNHRWMNIVLFTLILTASFGCSSNKAFKSGVIYTCDEGKRFVLEVYESVDIAFLRAPGKVFYLHRMPSEWGTKYSDGGTTLWIKGQSAYVEIEGRTEFNNCSAKPK